MDESAAQKRFAGLAMVNLLSRLQCFLGKFLGMCYDQQTARKSILRTRLNQNGVDFGAKIDSQNEA